MLLRLCVAMAIASVGCTPPSAAPEPTVAPSPATASPSAQPSGAVAAEPTCPPPCRGRPRVVGSFDAAAAPEASGIAASRRNPGVLYVVDDGPDTTSVLVLRARNARVLGHLRIAGMRGVDTEDVAVARCRPQAVKTCLFVGDIGDNAAARDSVEILRVSEPRIGGSVPDEEFSADRAVLRYPRGAHDAETLMVGDDGSLGIVTKAPGRSGRGAARLFVTDGFGDATLEDAGRVRLPGPAFPLAAAVVGNVVTGGDIARDRVVLRTYDALYEFQGPRDAALRDFPSWPVTELAAPPEPQGEAVAYATDGCTLFTVSEESGALTALRCR